MFSHFSCKGGSVAFFEVRLFLMKGTSNNPLGDSFFALFGECLPFSYTGTFMKSKSFLKSFSTPCLFCYSLRAILVSDVTDSSLVSKRGFDFDYIMIVSNSAFDEACRTRQPTDVLLFSYPNLASFLSSTVSIFRSTTESMNFWLVS